MSRDKVFEIYQEHIQPNYRMQHDGTIRKIRVRKELPDRIQELFGDFCTKLAITYPDFEKTVMEYVEDDTEAQPADRGCTDLDVALEDFVASVPWDIQHDRIRNRLSGRGVSMEQVRANITTFCWQKNQTLGREDTKYVKEVVLEHFKNYQSRLIDDRWIALRRKLSYRKTGLNLPSDTSEILRAIGVKPDRERFDRLMLVHWAWTIKRRFLLNDYTPSLPLMIVLAGPQGCGKSSFIEQHFTRPFADMVVNAKLDIIYDSREIEKYTNNLVVNFDELAKADNKSEKTSELLKNLITMSHTQGRVMFSTTQQRMEILTSFAATTNKHLSEVVRDETGARRYWVLETDGVENGQFDWDFLENFDWLTYWQSIDETREKGYFTETTKYYAPISRVQDSYCISPVVREWFENRYVVPTVAESRGIYEMTKLEFERLKDEDKPDAIAVISQELMYDDYAEDMKHLDMYKCSKSAFYRMLEKLGAKTIRKSSRYKNPYYVLFELEKMNHAETD